MIIASLTAFTSVKIVWETLEILHLVYVGHETGKHGYKAGNFITNAIQQRLREKEYKKDPLQKLVDEAQTAYDFNANPGDVEKAIEKFNEKTQTYFNLLDVSLGTLQSAKKHFFKTMRSLDKMLDALESKDPQKFSSSLSDFKDNFIFFKDKLNRFSLNIRPPDREILYITHIISKNTTPIERFNSYLKKFDECFIELKEIKEKIDALFEKDFRDNDFVPKTNSSSALSFEQLRHSIIGCIVEPELIEDTMQAILPKNSDLAGFCTEIAQMSTAFKKVDQTNNEETNLWNNDPNWLPLLTEEEQIEAGQRIFIHAMHKPKYSSETKFRIAKIFLYQYVSKYKLNQVIIKILSERLANLLIDEQIKICETLIESLNSLKQGTLLPEHDPNGVLDWLITTRKTVNSVAFWRKILVAPFSLSKYHLELLRPKLEILLPDEDIDLMIEEYRASYWGAIRKKSDQLIQLPSSFKTKIISDIRFQSDKEFSKSSNLITPLMDELSKLLVTELKILIDYFYEKKDFIANDILDLHNKIKEIRIEIRNLKHENGVTRIKESHRYITSIDEKTNQLFPYLNRPETIIEAEKKQQLPTVDDLIQVIYRGVDVHEMRRFEGHLNSDIKPLAYYFQPEHKKDSKLEAFAYAVSHCRINALPLLHVFAFPPANLAIEDRNLNAKIFANNPSLLIILKSSEKISIPGNSMALNNLSPRVRKTTEIFFKQLGDYYNLSYMRLNPEYHKQLPLLEKFKLLTQGLFNLGQEIRKKRFESVQIIIDNFQAIVSAEDIKSINEAITTFEENYNESYQAAERTFTSTLYPLVKKAINDCISKMNCLPEDEQRQLELEIEKDKVQKLQVNLNELTLEKEALEDKLRKSEAQRVRDREEMEALRKQDKVDTDAQINELRNFVEFGRQASSSTIHTPERRNRLFKP